MEEFCEGYGVRLNLSLDYYPQENGMAEAMNKVIVNNLKQNLEEKREKENWLDELPKVLWAQRTTRKGATGESPFSLVYEIEVVIPTYARLPTLMTLIAENVEEN